MTQENNRVVLMQKPLYSMTLKSLEIGDSVCFDAMTNTYTTLMVTRSRLKKQGLLYEIINKQNGKIIVKRTA